MAGIDESALDIEQIQAELAIPGEIVLAPRPDEVTDPSYSPATRGDTLEEVGGLEGYWEDDSRWDSSMEAQTFGPVQRVQDPAVLEVLARRAVVEALAVRDHSLGREAKPGLADAWGRGPRGEPLKALGVEVQVAGDGSASLNGDVESVLAELALDPSPEAATLEEEVLDAREARELLKSWDPAWMKISLQDNALKFAVRRSPRRVAIAVDYSYETDPFAGYQTHPPAYRPHYPRREAFVGPRCP